MADEVKAGGSGHPKPAPTPSSDTAFPINIKDIDLSKVMGGLAAAKGTGSTVMCCW